MKNLIFALTLALALVGCRREDYRRFTVEIPGIDASRTGEVVRALSRYDGIRAEDLKWDLAAKTLKVRYDSMKLAETNVRMAIAELKLEVVFPTNTTGRAGH